MEKTAPSIIKLLVIDIDGTLLNPEGTITPRTLTAVQAAQQAGIVVTLATGRRYCNTVHIARQLTVASPLIVYDGALIVQYPHAMILDSRPLQARVAQQAVELLVRHHLQPVIHPVTGLEEEIWTGNAALDNLWLAPYFSVYADQLQRMPYETLCAGHADPLRVVAFASEEAILRLIPGLSALDCSWTTVDCGNYGCAELHIMDAGCSKASGVVTLAQRLHIPLQQVMALGDNNNDIRMLQAVGWGVAMGQASNAVKAAAQAITFSNAEDGVAQAIERYALGNANNAASNSLKRTTCL